MSTPDVTTHGQIIRPDDMELLTKSDRIPERVRRLERALQLPTTAAVTLDPWHNVGAAGEPTFASGFSQYASFLPVGFRKDPFGRVHLRGLISTSVGGTMFTLPTGYRPVAQVLLDTMANGQGRVDVTPAGAVQSTGTPAGWITLDGLYFDTDSVTSYLAGVPGPAGVTGPAGPTGPTGGPGPPGSQGIPGVMEIYSQPATPPSTNLGAVWIDTDEGPPSFSIITENIDTALPTTGLVDGRVINYLADSTNGIVWRLRYRPNSSSAYKWEFLGGSPWRGEFLAQQAPTTNANDQEFPTQAPEFTAPFAGEYQVDFTITIRTNAAAVYTRVNMSINGVEAAGPQIDHTMPTVTGYGSPQNYWDHSLSYVYALTAGAKLRPKNSANPFGNVFFTNRVLMVRPVRVG